MGEKKQDRDGLYKRPDSPYWHASFINAEGRRTRQSTKTTDRKEAEAFLAQWRLQSHKVRMWGEEPARTFDDLMFEYLQGPSQEKAAPERDRYSAIRLSEHFSGAVLQDLGPPDIRVYRDKRKGEGAKGSTINREMGLLSAAINYARIEWGWEVPNPAGGRREREDSRIRWLTGEEAERLLRAARQAQQAPWLVDFILLGLHTGMRSGEMLHLDWSRVDWEQGLIYLHPWHQKKREKPDSVPLNRRARAALLARYRWDRQHGVLSRWVFCRRDGSRVASIKKGFEGARKRAGIPDLVPHDLRHTCAAWLVQAGVPLIEVRDLLRHSSVKVTERYAHLAPSGVRSAVGRLDRGG